MDTFLISKGQIECEEDQTNSGESKMRKKKFYNNSNLNLNIELLEHREYSLTRNAVEDIIRLGDTDQKADIYDKYGII